MTRIADLRIASLSPAMTDAAIALGLGERIVGRTPWCPATVAEAPVVGTLVDFDAERLLRLRPTHLLVQPPRSGIEPGLDSVARSLGAVVIARHLDGVEDVRSLLAALPGLLGFMAPGAEGGATETDGSDRARLAEASGSVLEEIDRSIAAARTRVAGHDPGRVLLLFACDPVMAFGSGSYLGDLLLAIGGTNALALRGFPELSVEDVQRLAPDAIVLVRTAGAAGTAGAAIDAHEETLRRFARRLDVPATRRGRLGVLVHPSAMLPGPAVGGLAAALAATLESLERGTTAR